MAVVPFKRARRRRLSLRHYICTEAGPFRLTSRLARELAHGEVAVPQYANSIQRMVEVFVESIAGEITDIQIRPTYARFDQDGKADLRYAAESMAVIIGALESTKIGGNVFDVTETRWRVDPYLKKAIMADVRGDAKLPLKQRRENCETIRSALSPIKDIT